jgi:hypothetical protein
MGFGHRTEDPARPGTVVEHWEGRPPASTYSLELKTD